MNETLLIGVGGVLFFAVMLAAIHVPVAASIPLKNPVLDSLVINCERSVL